MTTPASPKAALMPSVIEFACTTMDDVDLFNESIDGIVKQQLGRRAGHPAYANRPAPRLLVAQVVPSAGARSSRCYPQADVSKR